MKEKNFLMVGNTLTFLIFKPIQLLILIYNSVLYKSKNLVNLSTYKVLEVSSGFEQLVFVFHKNKQNETKPDTYTKNVFKEYQINSK